MRLCAQMRAGQVKIMNLLYATLIRKRMNTTFEFNVGNICFRAYEQQSVISIMNNFREHMRARAFKNRLFVPRIRAT